MNKEKRLLFKVLFSVLGVFIITYILIVSIRMNMYNQPEGEYMRLQDALILTEALHVNYSKDEAFMALRRELSDNTDAKLYYMQFLKLATVLTKNPGKEVFSNGEGETVSDIVSEYEKEYKGKYKEEFYFLKQDFYDFYDRMLAYYDMEEIITQRDITVLGTGDEITDENGNVLAGDRLLTTEGENNYLSDTFSQNKFMVLRTYQKADSLSEETVLLTIKDIVSRGFSLHNTWIVEAQENGLQIFTMGYEVFLDYEKSDKEQREQIADMEFADGRLQSLKIKKEKINGKLLSVRDGIMEIEGIGKFPYDEKMKVYRLYGSLKECEQKELRLGYDFTDFVLDEGTICAGLITRDEAMKNIRIVIKNSDFTSAYHESLVLSADTEFTLRYGNYGDMEEKTFAVGEKLEINKDSEYFKGDRIFIEPAAYTGRMKLMSVERAQGTPTYRGTLEIARTDEGLVIVNELLLEEYLYSVVPSEMPASYPIEALKAQAVCARTYAYRHMMKSGIAGFGAHVDDSAGFQVYNNIAENAQTTKAVKETSGQLLYYGEALCGAYYYSTSCGFGTDTNIWKSDNKEDTSYLLAKRIGTEEGNYSKDDMIEEEEFTSFITQTFQTDYEEQEAWYRWNYEVKRIEEEKILALLKKRYDSNNKLILTKDKNGEYTSLPVEKLGKIKNIHIEKRNKGGAADELIIEGKEKTYKVISEHNIRYVLSNGESKVIRQDGSEVAAPSLLPSGYMVIQTGKEDDVVIGYTIIGGGYGHGVGMSQNGAKQMAKTGMQSQDILTFFYQSCEVKEAY